MEKYGILIAAGLALLVVEGCMIPQHVLYDNRIPLNDRSEKYQEVLGAQRAANAPTYKDVTPADGIICANDSRYAYAWAGSPPNGNKEDTCFFQGQVECETPGMKYRFGPINWAVGERHGVVNSDENGVFFVPLKKTDRYGQIALQVREVRIISEFKNSLEFKVPEAACRRK